MMYLTDVEIQQLIEKTAETTVNKCLCKGKLKTTNRNDAYTRTLHLMKNYNAMRWNVEHSDNQSMTSTKEMLRRIDNALEIIKVECERSGERLKLEAFKMKFEDGYTYEQIAEKLETHENTPHNWVNQILRKLSVYLFGVDAIN